MRTVWKRWVFAVLLLLAVVALVRVARALREPSAFTVLRDSVAVLRAAADSCRGAIGEGEARLQEYHQRLDTMRARVRGLEALHPRGVPADSYAVYMAAFETYNDSAAGWQERVDTLRAQLARCRAVTETHNTAADSLRSQVLRQK
jgi:hypothetical protein